MNADLESYRLQLVSIRQDVPGVWNGLTDDQFNWKPAPEKWSIGDCFAHLNETAKKTVPTLDEMISRARAQGLLSDGPFVLGLIERMFVKMLEPPPRMRGKAPARLQPVPATRRSLDQVSREFMEWQDAIDARLDAADGIHLTRVKGPSPAQPLIKWTLLGMLSITLAHERRHIWQAREVRNHRAFPRG